MGGIGALGAVEMKGRAVDESEGMDNLAARVAKMRVSRGVGEGFDVTRASRSSGSCSEPGHWHDGQVLDRGRNEVKTDLPLTAGVGPC